MTSKFILLLGGILASLIVFLCIKNENKERVPKVVKVIPTTKTVKKEIILKESTFSYTYNNHNIDGLFSITEQPIIDNIINNYCKNLNCNKNIRYKGHVKKSNWRKLTSDTMLFFQKYNIKDSKIVAKGNNISIEGTLNSEDQFYEINSIINDNNSSSSKLNITNKIIFIPIVLPTTPDIQKLQEDINKTLEKNPIYFKLGSDILTKESKETLLEIISSLNKLDTKSTLLIGGHTDARGKKSYNLILSNKRARRVKSFFEDNGLEDLLLITAKGFGSLYPKMKDPKDPKNRRVEITIKRADND